MKGTPELMQTLNTMFQQGHEHVSFGYDKVGQLENIFIMRNPDKLLRLEKANFHDGANGALNLAVQSQ